MRGNRILVPFGITYGDAVKGLGKICGTPSRFMNNSEEYKLVLFTGGSDVDPSLYGETSPFGMCGTDPIRDKLEKRIFDRARRNNVPMAGICRGAQFLNVMAGGRMMHHIDGHAGRVHRMELMDGRRISVNSLHHQMIIPAKKRMVIGWSEHNLSRRYFGDGDKRVRWEGKVAEAIIMPNINACGVQYHPEIMRYDSNGYIFFHKMVEDMLTLTTEKFVEEYAAPTQEQEEQKVELSATEQI